LPFCGYTRTPEGRRVSGGYKEDHNAPGYDKISIYIAIFTIVVTIISSLPIPHLYFQE
jgi:hypothetical protein